LLNECLACLDVCPPQPPNLIPVDVDGNYRQCYPHARSGNPHFCPNGSACLYTGTANGFICCKAAAHKKFQSLRRFPPKRIWPMAIIDPSPAVVTSSSSSITRNQTGCSGRPGFIPVMRQGSPIPCVGIMSNMNCGQFGIEARCMWLAKWAKYVCCTPGF
uniref:BPTI/Kunitz inhibitor domain-containing protein n=1 Tax=Gongylonema pulchrum TaxID=637853 RepID=A0A183CZS6_9BILA